MNKFLGCGALCFLLFCVLPTLSLFCNVNVKNSFNERQPLILQANSNEFAYPARSLSSSLKLSFYQTLRAVCPQDNLVVFNSNLNVAEANIRCFGLAFFELIGTGYVAPFRQIGCSQVPTAQANTTAALCPNGTIAMIGFQLQSNAFVPTIDQVCHNETLGQTHWAHHRIVNSIRKRQREFGLPPYMTGPFYPNITVNSVIYTRDSQRTRLQTLLNSSALVDMYIPTTGNNYLVEGMLVPRSDMFYQSQQYSTFFYINTVPMWRSVRDNNWRLVEEIVRKTASSLKRSNSLDVWTGAIDTLTFNNASGVATEITLTTNVNGTGAIPVPRYLFKYVVDQARNRGIVYITVNDPYATTIAAADQLCTPLPQCTRLYPQFATASRGYTYCCAIDSSSGFFARAASLGLPTFPTAQVLTKKTLGSNQNILNQNLLNQNLLNQNLLTQNLFNWQNDIFG